MIFMPSELVIITHVPPLGGLTTRLANDPGQESTGLCWTLTIFPPSVRSRYATYPVIAVQGEDVCQYRFSTIGKTEGRWPTHGIDKSSFAVIA